MEEQPQQPKPVEKDAVERALRANEEYMKLKAANDALEKELERKQQLKTHALLDGKANAGQPEEDPKAKAEREAAEILKNFM